MFVVVPVLPAGAGVVTDGAGVGADESFSQPLGSFGKAVQR